MFQTNFRPKGLLPNVPNMLIGPNVEASLLPLFAGGTGAAYDFGAMNLHFTDIGRTTPVTAAGQTVSSTLDISGNNNHITWVGGVTYEVDAAGRGHLLFDGSTGYGTTPFITSLPYRRVIACAGIRKLSDAAAGSVVEGVAGNGFYMFAPAGASATYSFRTFGTTAFNTGTIAGFASPTTNVILMQGDNTGAATTDQLKARVNAADVTLTGMTLTTSAGFVSAALNIGRRSNGSNYLNARLYTLVVAYIPANKSAAEVAALERWTNARTGAY